MNSEAVDPMNLRRGFFRLWLVLAVLWIAGMTFAMFDNLKALGWLQRDGTIEIAERHQIQMDPTFRYLSLDRQNEVINEIVAIFGWTSETVKNAPVVDKPNPDQQAKLNALNRKVSDEVWELRGRAALRTYAYFAFLPPLILLIIGSAIGWAFSGFRK